MQKYAQLRDYRQISQFIGHNCSLFSFLWRVSPFTKTDILWKRDGAGAGASFSFS